MHMTYILKNRMIVVVRVVDTEAVGTVDEQDDELMGEACSDDEEMGEFGDDDDDDEDYVDEP